MRKLMTIGAALLVTATFGATAPSSAQGLEFRIGPDGMRLRERCDPNYEDCYDRRNYRRRGCDADMALDKADRMGIDRARVSYVGGSTIRVRGRDEYGERVTIVFGRDRGCPVLDY
jgi:hypothetical protein